jgi:hypothetical protein
MHDLDVGADLAQLSDERLLRWGEILRVFESPRANLPD